MSETCERCRFWEETDADAEMGDCHRYPPSFDGRAGFGGMFPDTSGEYWCGEWMALSATEKLRRASDNSWVRVELEE